MTEIYAPSSECLERRKETANHRVGKPGMVAATHRAGGPYPARNCRRLSESRRDRCPGRGSAGNHHAPLRALQDAAHFQSPRLGLGQAARRCRRSEPMLDRLLHHGHVLKCGPRSWRTKTTHRLPKGSADQAGRAKFLGTYWQRDRAGDELRDWPLIERKRRR